MYRTVVWLQFFTFTVFAGEFGPVVKISNGKIRGTIQKTAQQKNFHVFEGIPYAAPPIGNRRFKILQEPDAWEDVFQAVNNSHVCMQGNELGTKLNLNRIETEDCLYLNVFTPADLNNADKQNLPVLVWIHGGSFQYGSKRRIQPHYFMDYDVVVVVINYRLGVFGFLSTQDGVIPGNLGLKDQRFALQWVSKNIKQFGGDPHKVTLAGQSAGSVAASYQLLALQNKEFIAGVILESGSALCHHDFQPTPKPIAYELGRLLVPKFAGNSEDLLNILNKQSAEELKEASGSFSLLSQFLPLNDPTQVRSLTNIWLPVVEDANDPNNLIPSPMHQAFIDGNFLKVPVIAGFASEEIVAFSDTKNMLTNAYKLDDNPGLLVNDKLNIKNRREAGEKLKAVYTDSFEKNPTAMIQFLSDNLYATPVLRQADLANKHTPVYLYQFSYQNSLNKKTPIEGAEGVGHGSELLFLFGNQTFVDKTDQLVHERMMKLWTNFIKFQNPTPRDDPILIKWPRTTSNNLEYLDINSTLNISSSPRKYTGWKKVLDEFIAPPLSVY